MSYITCPQCQTKVYVAPADVDLAGNCPGCGRPFRIPARKKLLTEQSAHSPDEGAPKRRDPQRYAVTEPMKALPDVPKNDDR